MGGSGWITGYVTNDTTRMVQSYTYGPAGMQDIRFSDPAIFSYYYLNGSYPPLGSSGTITGQASIRNAYFENSAAYVLSGAIAASGLVRQQSGRVTVTGTLNAGQLEVTVSTLGYAAMVVSGGGKVTAADYASSDSALTIDGAGSLLSAAHVYVGSKFGVYGQLSVTNGGKVQASAEFDIGHVGQGSASVDGAGSSLVAGTYGRLDGGGGLAVGNGGLVRVGSSGSGGYISVQQTTIAISGAQSTVTVDRVILDGGSAITGSGHVAAAVANDGRIAASGGTLLVDGAITGTGALTIAAGANLKLMGSVAAGQTVTFSFGSGQLILGALASFKGTIAGFAGNDQIDLAGVAVNEAEYDPVTGNLSLYNTTYGSTGPRPLVGTIHFVGLAPTASVAIGTDQAGSTMLTVGTPMPDTLTLARIADAVYGDRLGASAKVFGVPIPLPGPGSTGVYDSTSDFYFNDKSLRVNNDPDGFTGEVWVRGNQIVVAFRGTDDRYDFYADGSWANLPPPLTALPTALLRQQVADAARLLAAARQAYPTAQITLTGHSLGGALAQLLAQSSGYRAVAFDAPGAGQLYGNLASEVAPARNAGHDVARQSTNYVLKGDQVSWFGVQMGGVQTYASPLRNTWENALNNHRLGALIDSIQTNTPEKGRTYDQLPPSYLVRLAQNTASTARMASFIADLVVDDIRHAYSGDPGGHTSVSFVGAAGSPALTSAILPAAPGVIAYVLSALQGGTWTAPILVAPGATTTFGQGAPVTGFRFTAVDDRGVAAILEDNTIFSFTFASTGAFHGTLTESLTLAPSPDPLFDPGYYLATNPDVAASRVDPYLHYMTIGWKEGRNPDAFFDTAYYLKQNPDVAAAGINPLAHFEANGWKETRQPSLAFSDAAYLRTYADVAAAGINPLVHFLQDGEFEGRVAALNGPALTAGSKPDPLVITGYAARQVASIVPDTFDGAAWYHGGAWKLGINPDPWFDTTYYLAQNPDVKAAGVDPVSHYETSGWKEGRAPSLLFSDTKYLQAYADVAGAGIEPLAHYISNGQGEGRMTFLTGGTAAADPLVDAAYYDRQLGATLLPASAAAAQQAAWSYDASGWQRGLNPDPWFDTNYYLSHNPDVATAHVNPLKHFEAYGWREGRDPSAQFSASKYLGAYADVRAAGINPLQHFVQYGAVEGRAAFQS